MLHPTTPDADTLGPASTIGMDTSGPTSKTDANAPNFMSNSVDTLSGASHPHPDADPNADNLTPAAVPVEDF